MSETDNGDDTDTSMLGDVNAEEVLEGTQLEDAVDEDDENLGESIGRATGAIIGRRIGELVGRKVTERISGGSDEETEETRELTISIENDDGDPLQGATVTAKGEDSSLVGGLIGVGESQETDDDGEATFQLADGDYAIEADTEGGSAEDDVTIEGDDEAISLTIEEADENENGEEETEPEDTDEEREQEGTSSGDDGDGQADEEGGEPEDEGNIGDENDEESEGDGDDGENQGLQYG